MQVENLLKSLDATTVPVSHPQVAGAVQKGNVALASNGTTVAGQAEFSERLLDGQIPPPADSSVAMKAPTPSEWLITFDKLYSLREIRMMLYMRSPRYYHYKLSTSPDGQTYTALVDYSKEKRSGLDGSGLEIIKFPPRPVKSIKLEGKYNSKSALFLVVEFEAYCIPPK